MREIKFRAWDDILLRMMPTLTLEEIAKNSFGCCNWYQFTLMQYAGLKDKNGKEIFEGDILSISCYSYTEPEEDYEGIVSVCCFGNALFVIKDDGTTEYLYLNELVGSYTTIYEVIGNIYENQELIKEVE